MNFLLISLGSLLLLKCLVRTVAPLTGLSGFLNAQVQWNAQQTMTGASAGLAQLTPSGQVLAQASFSSVGTTVANEANQVSDKVYSIAASGSTSIDLTAAIRNIVNDPTATFARIKSWMIRHLSTAQNSTNGGSASSITIGNSGANDWITQSGSTGLGSATSTFVLRNGAAIAVLDATANGTVIDGTHKILKITNNDGTNAAGVEVVLIGADA